MDEISPIILKKNSKVNILIYSLFFVFILFILMYYLFSTPIDNKTTSIHVSNGETLNSIISDLQNKKVVQNGNILKGFVYLFKSDRQITKGDYLFTKNQPVFSVAWQIARGIHNIEPIKITFKEGITNQEMVNILENKLPNFDKDLFIHNKDVEQGYLFPDTYFFYPLTTTNEVIDELTTNFKRRISFINSDIISSGKSLSEIITMASILEKEARGKEDVNLISGILWKRIKKGMMLQVDADPSTYKVYGLPSEPICNPGLVSIKGAMSPTDSPYLFYLHDSIGNVHFAQSFSEHKSNITKYLK